MPVKTIVSPSSFFFLSSSKNPALFLWQLDFKASVLNARHHWVNEGYVSVMPGNYCKLKTGGQKTETFEAGQIAKKYCNIEEKAESK